MKKAVKGLLLAALAVFTIFALQQGALLAQAPILGNDHKLEGAWEAVIWLPTDPTHPATTTFAPTPYRILRTVAPAGVTDSYSFPPLGFVLFQFGQPGGTNGPGNGDYKRIGYNLYSATVKYYELNYSLGTPQNGFSPLEAVGTVRENIKLSADGNSYESDFVTTFTDGAGNPAPFPNYGKTKATRIVVQPLQ